MADKVLRDNTLKPKRFGKDVSQFLIDSRSFNLRAMPMGRIREMALSLTGAVDRLKSMIQSDVTRELPLPGSSSASTETPGAAGLDLADVLMRYGDVLFGEVATFWNWLFRFKEPDYQDVDAKWVEEVVTPGMVEAILTEITKQSRVPWLLPTLASTMQRAVGQWMVEAGETKEASAGKSSTTS